MAKKRNLAPYPFLWKLFPAFLPDKARKYAEEEGGIAVHYLPPRDADEFHPKPRKKDAGHIFVPDYQTALIVVDWLKLKIHRIHFDKYGYHVDIFDKEVKRAKQAAKVAGKLRSGEIHLDP